MRGFVATAVWCALCLAACASESGDGDAAYTFAGDGRPSTGETPLPCEVQRVMTVSCQGCHARDPGASAPMALVTHEDLIAPAVSDASRRVIDLVLERIHEVDRARAMPPPSSRRLISAELAVLDAFAARDAPAGDEACEVTVTPDGAHDEVEPPADLGTCYEIRVHDRPVAHDSQPYNAPIGDYESCFYMDVPWPEGTQALTIRSIETPLVHHWELFHTHEMRPDGDMSREVESCDPAFREVIAIYARGQQKLQVMPEGVGLVLPPPGAGHGLMLDVHYFNPGAAARDDTRVEICTAAAPRENAATVSALMTPYFELPAGQAFMVDGQCAPAAMEDIHVFRTFPHMHARGVRVQLQIARSGGATDTLLDVPFDFGHQITYETEAVVRAGDRVLTTCHFINDTDAQIVNGARADEEMCINFVYAWPAGALSNGFIEGLSTPCLF